jgi:uncharacterized protein YecE (DUF72 family)
MSIHIGTSGWAYREWRGLLYPKGLPADRHLAHYTTHFNAVELNGTAYRIPTVETVERWAAAMPAGFLATVKLPHAITHFHRLRDSGALLEDTLIAVRRLGEHLGPLLAQLPPGFAPDPVRMRDFLAEARGLMADPSWPLVVEFRHPDWLTAQVAQLLDDAHATWCVADMPYCRVGQPTERAPLLYIRRHGTDGRYRGSYADEVLARDAEQLCAWHERGAQAFIFFNNTADGAALHDAARLQAMVDECLHRRTRIGDRT